MKELFVSSTEESSETLQSRFDENGIAQLLVHVHPPEITEIPEFVVGAN